MYGKLSMLGKCISRSHKELFLTMVLTTSITQASCDLSDFSTPMESSQSTQINSTMQASGDPSDPSQPMESSQSTQIKVQPTLEVKNGYFFFTDSKMRKVYDQGGWDLQLSGSYPIWRWLQVYGSVEYLQRHGKSLKGHQKTSIWEVPLSLGLKSVITIRSEVQYYITLGPRYVFVHQHNDSSYVDKNVSNSGIGGFVNTGFNFILRRHFLIDVFGEYSFAKIRFHPDKKQVQGRSVQVDGLTFGLGLGYAF